jgi:hypothetical protein
MPGNPVKKRPQSDLVNQIPSDWSPELQKAYDKALKDYKSQMPAGDILDYVRTPFNVMSNSMAGLGAEMIGKGKQFEAKYGWMPKTQAEMNAVEAMMRVMEPVIDTMDYLKIPPIVGPNTPTIAAAIQGVDRAAARLTAEQAKKAAANAGKAVKNAATSDDMAYALENLAQKTGFGPKQIMIGRNAKTFRHADAALAAQMEKDGKSRADIWQATRTFRAPDNELRQELSDADMKYTSGAVEKKQYTNARKRYEQAKARATTPEELNDANDYWNKKRSDVIFNLKGDAADFVDHPELFAAYPELAKYTFNQLEPTHNQFTAAETVNGFYSPGGQRITINTDAPYKRSTALHELQHAIQEIEGWQGGSSPDYTAAKMAERDIAKKEAKEIQDRIDNMKATDPVLYADLIRNEEGALGQRQYLLSQTAPLEGITDPYEAYKRMSGEAEARVVQARRDYTDDQLRDKPPFTDYDVKPWDQITKDFAAGGEVRMAGGGFLEMMAKAAKEGVTRAQRLAMNNKDVAKRIPALEEAIAALERGEITKQQYAQLVQAYKPVAPYETFFKPESDEKIIGALTQTNREKEGTRPKQGYFGVPSSTLKRGDKAATRQDIPAYTHADTWVVTAHEPQQGRNVYAGAGPRIGYEPMAMLNDVKFQVRPDGAMKIAKGGQKGTIATMEGYWEPITRELAEEMGPELMRDPRWVQAGMDPTRSASFYDRKTMQPILEGEQVLHSGPLVLVKNPLYGDIEDFPFKEGGAVMMAKGGILGALAKTAEKGMERVTKGAQQVLPAAERAANLEAFLAKSQMREPVYHATPKDIKAFKPGGDDPTMSGRAIWTTTSKTNQPAQHNIGSRKAEFREGVNVMPLHGRAERPLMLDDPGMVDWAQEVFAGGSREFPELLADKWLKEVKDAGYDSVILADPHKRGDPHEVIFFEPTQLKSEIGNRGTYDINDPDLNKAQGGEVHAAKGGLLGALAKTAEKGLERVAKAVPVAQRAIVGAQEILPTAEREANLAKFLESSKVKDRLYRGAVGFEPSGMPEGFLQAQPRAGYASFASTNPAIANTYAMPDHNDMENMVGAVTPLHVQAKKLIEFPNWARYPNFDKFEFDRWAQRLKPGEVLVVRNVTDTGPRSTYKVDPQKLHTYGSDIYAWNEGTNVKSATGNRGTYDVNDPDINKATGGEVHMAGGGKMGVLGALARTAERGMERALKAAPQDEALRLAQLRAALPPAQGGLGLPANNTPMDRANAMGFVKDTYHGGLRNVKKLDPRKGSTESHAGQGVYSTDSPKDASQNYASVYGPDVEAKINRSMDEQEKDWRRIHSRLSDEALTPRQQEILLANTLDADNIGVVYPLKVRSEKSIHLDRPEENPVTVGPFVQYDEAADRWTETPHYPTFEQALDEYSQRGGETNPIRDFAYDYGEEIPARDLFNAIQKQGAKDYLYDPYTGDLISGGVAAADFLKHFGIDEVRHTPQFNNRDLNIAHEHTISLNPDNVRSRFAAFDPWRKDAATAAAFGVAAPDLLAQEQEPEKELTIEEFLKRMKAK